MDIGEVVGRIQEAKGDDKAKIFIDALRRELIDIRSLPGAIDNLIGQLADPQVAAALSGHKVSNQAEQKDAAESDESDAAEQDDDSDDDGASHTTRAYSARSKEASVSGKATKRR
jgi:hypothetical protein